MAGLETAAALAELAGGLRELAKGERVDRGAAQRAILALRTIYFTPSGTLSLLEHLARGELPSPDQVKTILPGFNDKEWRILRKLQELDYETLRKSGDLSLRQCRVLEEIRWGKLNLRANIQEFLNEALTTGPTPASEEAQKLLAEVRRLNLAIEAAEESLR